MDANFTFVFLPANMILTNNCNASGRKFSAVADSISSILGYATFVTGRDLMSLWMSLVAVSIKYSQFIIYICVMFMEIIRNRAGS